MPVPDSNKKAYYVLSIYQIPLTFILSDYSTIKMASHRTRAKTEHPLFGQAADLPANQLPTIGDVLKLILQYKTEDQEGNSRFGDKNLAIKEAAQDVTNH